MLLRVTGVVVRHSEVRIFAQVLKESQYLSLSSPNVYKLSFPKSFIGNPDQLYFFVFQSVKIVIFTSLTYMEGLFLHILHEVETWLYSQYSGFPQSLRMTLALLFPKYGINVLVKDTLPRVTHPNSTFLQKLESRKQKEYGSPIKTFGYDK